MICQRFLAALSLLFAALACRLSPPVSLSDTAPLSATGAAPTSAPVAPSLTAHQLKNASYRLNAAPGARPTVQLTDGVYLNVADPASPDFADVRLLDPMAFGDLNGDGAQDAAVLLAENYGGTGVFVSVMAVLNQDGQPVHYGSSRIDDGPMINGISIQNGLIIVDATIHGTNDPHCCPNFPVVETFRLTKSGLTLQRFVSRTPDGAERSITLEGPDNGTQVSASVEVRGSFTISPFENTLAYRIYDAAGNQLAAGPITVNAELGGPGIFETALDLSDIPAGLVVRLEILDLSAADGSTLAMNSVELVIK